MSYSPILIVAGEPNSVFLEIFFKVISKNKIKSPIILITSKKLDKTLIELTQVYRDKPIPEMPIGADILMTKYNIPAGKELGLKLKTIEEEWVRNNFQISDKEVENIIKS